MSYKMMQNIHEELDKIAEKGLNTSNLETAYKLIDMWKEGKKFTDFINYDKLEEYRDFGGIRNEEDYLITETGARRLGKKIPLTPEEVEALR